MSMPPKRIDVAAIALQWPRNQRVDATEQQVTPAELARQFRGRLRRHVDECNACASASNARDGGPARRTRR
jgi:hypothetical protein